VESGISIAPGPMFSARRQFGNFLRLNCGHPWTSRMDRAVQRLGEILRRGRAEKPAAPSRPKTNIPCEIASTRGSADGSTPARRP
jgi:hypothetical protein